MRTFRSFTFYYIVFCAKKKKEPHRSLRVRGTCCEHVPLASYEHYNSSNNTALYTWYKHSLVGGYVRSTCRRILTRLKYLSYRTRKFCYEKRSVQHPPRRKNHLKNLEKCFLPITRTKTHIIYTKTQNTCTQSRRPDVPKHMYTRGTAVLRSSLGLQRQRQAYIKRKTWARGVCARVPMSMPAEWSVKQRRCRRGTVWRGIDFRAPRT